jgi:hypothetical protein
MITDAEEEYSHFMSKCTLLFYCKDVGRCNGSIEHINHGAEYSNVPLDLNYILVIAIANKVVLRCRLETKRRDI